MECLPGGNLQTEEKVERNHCDLLCPGEEDTSQRFFFPASEPCMGEKYGIPVR